MRRKDREQLLTIFQFLQENDPKGNYLSYMDDIDAGEIDLQETASNLIRLMERWKNGPHRRKSSLKKKMTDYQLVLASIV